MTATISERATAGSGHNRPPQRVTCPCCEATFELNKVGKPRSIEQHRRFFQIIRAAFAHWPEGHEEQFSTQDALRGWLTMKAGPAWREEVCRMHISGMCVEHVRMIASQIVSQLNEKCTVRVHNGVLVIFKPKSLRFDKLSHLAFCALNEAVADVIKAEMNVTVEELLEQGTAREHQY